ncbi:hypothetical protein F1D05_12760 [Kribbella qitaiheensis]|uniref:Lipoprotein n=1 Tax=Kribbella qitaiheensis TaxID=1544730 RepID=A0A7G6WXA4_9ACTN|nr:SurA N-terminal domain-containing protein [Kribbella qitaiheensis]QNE18619.1 hypothetical protein F1D05_12760 [Kribbella qitaiheensis]
MSRNLVKVTGALASVVLLGGCAAGTHPGAAAKVGKTEISVTDVDETSRSVSKALAQPFTTGLALGELVNSALVEQITEQRSIAVTDAEVAEAMKAVVPDQTTYDRFAKDPVANTFLHDVAEAVIGTIKLGGGTGVKDPNVQQAQQAGQGIVKDAAKNITVDIAPRFGKWTDGTIDGKVSGSLSTLSKQTEAGNKPADPQQQDPNQQPQDPNQPQPSQPQPQG